MRLKSISLFLSLLLGGGALGDAEGQEVGPRVSLPTPGTRRMAERLKEVADAWDQTEYRRQEDRLFATNHPAWIPQLRDKLQTSQRLEDIFYLRQILARELLHSGRSDEALTELDWLYRAVVASAIQDEMKGRLLERIQGNVAVAFLRQAEEQNCIAQHNADSCIFPIRGGGIHGAKNGSRMAVKVLSTTLAEKPDDLGARWLLNLAYMTLGRYPQDVPASWRIPPATFASEHDLKAFPNLAPKLGIDAVGLAGGCCVEDFDGDGDLDIVASSWGLRDPLRFFRQKPDGMFEERTEAAGLSGELGGLNLCHADYDNDGAVDILVLRGGWLEKSGRIPNSLLRNLGDGTFDDVTEKVGLLAPAPTQTAAWGDFDRDGRLDLFVGCEQEEADNHPSRLYRQNGDGTFTDCARASGVADLGFVKGSAWGDIDNDGDLDLYVSRIGQANLMLMNEGPAAKRPRAAGQDQSSVQADGDGVVAWRFTDVTSKAGVAEPVYSFPCWFFDYDNDGWLDLFVGGFDGASIAQVAGEYIGRPHQQGHPRLYRNRGDGTFSDVTRAVRLDRALLVMGAGFGDIDNDGFPDIYLGTGAPALATLMPNRMFRNAEGRAFQDVTTSGGFGHLQKGHGVAFADVDGDGDQDVYAVQGGWYTCDVSPNALFLNPGQENHWITLRLRGRRSNRSAIGARIRITVRSDKGRRDIYTLVSTGGSFGSTSLQQEVGLGKAAAIEQVEIRWPSGVVQVLRDIALDRVVDVEESG